MHPYQSNRYAKDNRKTTLSAYSLVVNRLSNMQMKTLRGSERFLSHYLIEPI
jgi:hypothetical protein